MRIFPPTWPIAWRLTFLYALSLFLLLFTAATLLDWILVSDMQRGNDRALSVEMQSLRMLLKQRPDDVMAWREEIDREAIGSVSGYARYYVRILDERRNTILETSGMNSVLDARSFPKPAQAHLRDVNGVAVRGADGRPFMATSQWVAIYRPVTRKWVIQMALDRSYDAETMKDYRKMVTLILVAGVLFSASLGFFIAKTGLRPLSKLAQVFTRITSEHLNERVGTTHWPPEIASLAQAFDSMLQRLERSFALLSHFSANLAHELRTPIGNLRGEAEVALGRARTAEEYRKVIESSLEEYERLTRVIENLLFLARSDTHNTTVRFSPVNTRQEIDALLEYFEGLAEEKSIEVTSAGNALLNADPTLLRRAITNLLSNAFQYTPPHGRISVDVSTDNGAVVITVSDTGIGIEKASLEKISQRFYRTERARAMNRQGSGLGLAIVKSIMDLHSGDLKVESTPGEGTTVRMRFPTA
jgi:two-component system, OmpR family, heavy metal sensor histidine kinase CusS